jgi:hydroxymethylpyrimidine pyrophosphatase-like HAD family hydrolase
MDAEIRLIATDLDGTLIGGVNEFPLYKDFRDKINELRRHNNAVWAACTGRSRRSFREFFSPMQSMGIMPDYVIVNHAYISKLRSIGYVPHFFWNLRIRYLIWSSQLHSQDAIREWHQMIRGGAHGVRTVRLRRNRLHLRFDSEESAKVAASLLRDKVKPYRHLHVFEYMREVDVRPVPFTKGLALQELARHLDIGRENILAIGNGHNDISMLDGTVAAFTGCPVNSDAEVMEVVHEARGHIATCRALTGVMEILGAYEGGEVCSDLPENWRPPDKQPHPRPEERRRHGQGGKREWRKAWWGLGILYAVAMVFASFGLLPFSGVIMKPYNWLMSLVTRLMELVW